MIAVLNLSVKWPLRDFGTLVPHPVYSLSRQQAASESIPWQSASAAGPGLAVWRNWEQQVLV